MAAAGIRRETSGAVRLWAALFAVAAMTSASTLLAQTTTQAPEPVQAPTPAEAPPPPRAPTFAERFTAGDFAGALPIAQTELAAQAKTAPGSQAHVTALLNLASTQYKLGDYASAIDRFAEAAKLAGEAWGDNSPRNIAPLRGLGFSLLAQQRTAEAVPVLARAVALSRRHMGLFNDEQNAIALPLSRAYQQLGMTQEAEREEQYAYRGAESRYGTADLRLLPALDRLARWYEDSGRPAQARYLHRRAFTLATEPKKTSTAGAVHALVGVARTYFIEFRDGPEATDEDDPFPNGNARLVSSVQQSGPPAAMGYYLDPQAERALQLAIMIADKSGVAALRQEATTAYGDYLLLDGKAASAEKQYSLAAGFRAARVASGELSALEPDPLAKPQPLLVRRPNFTRRNEQADPDEVDIHTSVLSAVVTPQGKLDQIKMVSSDENASRQRMLLAAAERAIYRPALFNAGDHWAFATEAVELVFTSRTLISERPAPKPEVEKPKTVSPDTAPPEEVPPEEVPPGEAPPEEAPK
jgi:tetratricopeptide (TPR) repeat protein